MSNDKGNINVNATVYMDSCSGSTGSGDKDNIVLTSAQSSRLYEYMKKKLPPAAGLEVMFWEQRFARVEHELIGCS